MLSNLHLSESVSQVSVSCTRFHGGSDRERQKTSKERNEQGHGSQRWGVNDKKEVCPGRSRECMC